MTKIKGITIWEQYVEYFVLGAVVIVAMAYTAIQFIGNPNAVQHPQHGTIGPGDVDGILQREATRVNLLLAAPGTDDELELKRLRPEFETALTKSVAPSQRLAPIYAHVPLGGVGTGHDGAVVYLVPSIPSPSQIAARQYHDTVMEQAVEEHKLQELLPARPFDISWVTVGGVFDIAETVRRFKAESGSNDQAPIPSLWYDERSMVVNVTAEREELRDGQWADRQTLEAIPGQVHMHDILTQSIDASRRDELLRRIRDAETKTKLLRPPFYATQSGTWSPPGSLDQFVSEESPGSSDRVAFWSHDLTAQPERTYRYRFAVEVFNPFAARKLNLVEAQHDLAERYALRSEPSAWSEPITFAPPIRAFITRVDLPRTGAVGVMGQTMATASLEIYRFHDGSWREHRMSVQPGQRVGEARPERDDPNTIIDFSTEWYVLDIVPDPDATRGDPRAARVVLQNIRTGEIQERHPLWDAPGRDQLRREIQPVAAGLGG